jgi:hypothetical protein
MTTVVYVNKTDNSMINKTTTWHPQVKIIVSPSVDTRHLAQSSSIRDKSLAIQEAPALLAMYKTVPAKSSSLPVLCAGEFSAGTT